MSGMYLLQNASKMLLTYLHVHTELPRYDLMTETSTCNRRKDSNFRFC